MKTVYLLILLQEDYSEPIGRILIADNDIQLVIKGINKIEGQKGEYYQTYAKDILICGNPKYPTDGSYKDTVRWSNMSWYIEEMTILDY